MKTKNKKNIKHRLTALFVVIVSLFSSLIGGVGVSYAASSEDLLSFERLQYIVLNRYEFSDENGEEVSSSTALGDECAYKNKVTDFVTSYDCLYLGLTFEKDVFLNNNGNDYFVEHCSFHLMFDDLPVYKYTVLQYVGQDIFDVKLWYNVDGENKECTCNVGSDGVVELPTDIDSIQCMFIEYRNRAWDKLPGACLKLTTKDALASGDGESTGNVDTSKYTPVLQDLQKDETFNVDDYPVIEDDYSLQVIQIAESVNGELFVYVYQPCGTVEYVTAIYLNMSLSEDIDDTSLYHLTLLSSEGVFAKYLVNNVIVSSDNTRYYYITSIYRTYIEGIDTGSSDVSIITGKAFAVGKMWRFIGYGNDIECSAVERNVITVTDKYLGYLLYEDGYYLFETKKTVSNYLVFDTDFLIENLIEVDITYCTERFSQNCKNGTYYNPTYTDKSMAIEKTLYADEFGSSVNPSLWFHDKCTWKIIQPVSEFLKDETLRLSDEAKSNIKGKKWVLRFFDTNYNETHSVDGAGNYWSNTTFLKATDVSLLRLSFCTDCVSYDLGVVDNMHTGKDTPDNNYNLNWFDKLCLWLSDLTGIPAYIWKIILIAFPLVVILPIFSFIFPVVGAVMKVILKGLLWLLKGLWWLVRLPFKLIAKLFKKKE